MAAVDPIDAIKNGLEAVDSLVKFIEGAKGAPHEIKNLQIQLNGIIQQLKIVREYRILCRFLVTPAERLDWIDSEDETRDILYRMNDHLRRHLSPKLEKDGSEKAVWAALRSSDFQYCGGQRASIFKAPLSEKLAGLEKLVARGQQLSENRKKREEEVN